MSVNELSVRYKLATKTTSEWDAISYIVPLEGELCFYSDSGKAKLGDGSTTLANLEFLWLTTEEIQALIDAAQDGTLEEAIGQIQSDLQSRVPNTRKINGHELSNDITLSANDVNAIPVSAKGVGGGVAELDEHGYVPAHQLPSFVDDVVEGYLVEGSFYEDTTAQKLITPESGKLYVDISTTEYKCYRWSGTGYVLISDSVTLGITNATAFRGDWGKVAYDHATNKGNAYESGIYKITTNTEGHVTSATPVTKNDILNLGISDTDTKYDDASETSSGLMSAADKKKLNAIEDGANKYIHPSYNGASEGLYKITVDTAGHVTNVAPVTKEDLSEIGIDVDTGLTEEQVKDIVNDKSREVTTEEYGALSEEEKTNGTIYFITDTNDSEDDAMATQSYVESLINSLRDSLRAEIRQEIMNSKSAIGDYIVSSTLSTMEEVIARYGGITWEQVDGRFILGASETHPIGETGGEETHILIDDEMPSHIHTIQGAQSIYYTKGNTANAWINLPQENSGYVTNTSSVGGDQPHNNMPPFETAYIWKRIE